MAAVTIELEPEIEEQLRAEAKRRGQDPAAYASHPIEVGLPIISTFDPHIDCTPCACYRLDIEEGRTMAVVRLQLSLQPRIAATLRQRAAALNTPVSRYVADLVEADAREEQDRLAEEGYRLLSEDTRMFAEAALPLNAEVWMREEDSDGHEAVCRETAM